MDSNLKWSFAYDRYTGQHSTNWTNTHHSVDHVVRIVSGVTCILSILGSLAIIFSYIIIKSIRSKAREILVHLSVMDLTFTSANLIGLVLPYDRYLLHEHSGYAHDTYVRVCKAQAFIAVYGTIGSVLWTLGLAVYLYYRIVSRISVRLVRMLYVVCYTLPLYVSVWLLMEDWLGYPHNVLQGAGWCSVKDEINILVLLMTYDIWMWLGILTLVPLYLVIHVHVKYELKDGPHYPTMLSNNLSMIAKAERKLLLIPLLFIFLRIWDVIDNMLFMYNHVDDVEEKYLWLKMLTAIGDSGQGFFNFVIFFLFQPRLRTLIIRCCHWPCKRHNTDDDMEYSESGDDEPAPSTGDSTPLHFNQHTPRKH